MKYTLLMVTMFFSVWLHPAQVYAQKYNRLSPKEKTILFLNKTGKILNSVHYFVNINKEYTGFLHKAVEEQQTAIKKIKNKQYEKAVSHSYRARRYAFMAQTANRGVVSHKWRLDDDEKKLLKRMAIPKVTDDELRNSVTDEDKQAEEQEQVHFEEIENNADVNK